MPSKFIRLGIVAAMMTGTAVADTANLSAEKDNSLYESATGALSNGAGVFLFTGTTFQAPGQTLRRALLEFDIAGNIPAGATIVDVTLTMRMSRTITQDIDVGIHTVDQEWGEGASDASGQEGRGATAQANDATWLDTFLGTGRTWNTPGGDFNPVASATIPVGGVGLYTWGSTAQMVADVQNWLDNPNDNHGWIVIADESTDGTAKRFNSRESSTDPPLLTIEYHTCDGSPAAWSNYGNGWPGTGGVIPGFTASNDPRLCEPISLSIDNSSGLFTQAFLFIGFVSAQLPTGLGGELLLIPSTVVPFPLPGGGVSLPGEIPCDSSLCGFSVFMQVLQSDLGASNGVSFTPGLQLDLGN